MNFIKKYGGKTINYCPFCTYSPYICSFCSRYGQNALLLFMVYNLIGELCGLVFSVMPVIFSVILPFVQKNLKLLIDGYYCRFYIACRYRSRQE